MKIDFLPALVLLFIALKLTNVITWGWFWVLSPFIIPLSLILGIFLLVVLAKLVSALFVNKD